ncbi:Uncharacterised protein [Klebsiella pneumoniae]|nr:Uncharacterised protein [Klebsiella pneumoniae]
MFIGFGFNHCQRNARLVIQHDIGGFHRSSRRDFAAHDDLTVPEFDLLSDLRCVTPAGIEDGGQNAFGDDICFRQGTQVQVSHWGFSSNSDAQILHTKSDEIITLYVHYLS